jgi:acetyl/propionyl-CoA carboxylase alpha subunit
VHLGERECSIQRRYQKIVEEAPSPGVDAALRERLGRAALAIAQAAGYVNAGTVEFLLDGSGRFYFLEVNTRLQVEHPVTEVVTGVDLVHRQLHVAAGRPLGLDQERVALRGHAVECRVYAEDPEQGFAPSPGPVLLLHEPQHPGVRIDSGVRAGQHVSVHYDPIVSKIIAGADDRPAAITRMRHALAEYVLLGPKTNLEYLRAIISHPGFVAGELTTGFLRDHLAAWQPEEASAEALAIAAALVVWLPASGYGRNPDRLAADPWDRLRGWRLT